MRGISKSSVITSGWRAENLVARHIGVAGDADNLDLGIRARASLMARRATAELSTTSTRILP